jgi:hypothetical protein
MARKRARPRQGVPKSNARVPRPSFPEKRIRAQHYRTRASGLQNRQRLGAINFLTGSRRFHFDKKKKKA